MLFELEVGVTTLNIRLDKCVIDLSYSVVDVDSLMELSGLYTDLGQGVHVFKSVLIIHDLQGLLAELSIVLVN